MDVSRESRSSQSSEDDIEALRNALSELERSRQEEKFGEVTKYYEPSIAESEVHELDLGDGEDHVYKTLSEQNHSV